MQAGDTFILGPGGHLWVVISNPAKHAGKFIIVNLTTDVFRAGKECELYPGDHQWISEKSFVSLGDAREVNSKEEAKMVEYMAAGTITKHFPMNPTILQKIIVSGKQSKALPVGFRKYL